ncbi:MAG: prephenate dehydratase [Bacillaceae bacterium]|nr:prephenate dehydratase [Bacillaceae bacterium]
MERHIAFLGPRGTFTEEAARYLFAGEEDRFIPQGSIPDVLESVAEQRVEYGVVPMENSIEGSVNLTLDWMIHQVKIPILAELVLPIHQYLLTAERKEPLQPQDVEMVLSHPHAVAQCHHFMRTHMKDVEIEYTSSTAEAARIVSENPDRPWAAIGTKLSGQFYGLTILKEHIEDHDNNYTRFVMVGEKAPELAESDHHKTTVLVTLPSDFPGALYQVLAAFAWRKLNLSRIESRPTKKGLGSYHFIIDIEQGMDEVLLPGAFAEIEAIGCQISLLGSYPCYVKKDEKVSKDFEKTY